MLRDINRVPIYRLVESARIRIIKMHRGVVAVHYRLFVSVGDLVTLDVADLIL